MYALYFSLSATGLFIKSNHLRYIHRIDSPRCVPAWKSKSRRHTQNWFRLLLRHTVKLTSYCWIVQWQSNTSSTKSRRSSIEWQFPSFRAYFFCGWKLLRYAHSFWRYWKNLCQNLCQWSLIGKLVVPFNLLFQTIQAHNLQLLQSQNLL